MCRKSRGYASGDAAVILSDAAVILSAAKNHPGIAGQILRFAQDDSQANSHMISGHKPKLGLEPGEHSLYIDWFDALGRVVRWPVDGPADGVEF